MSDRGALIDGGLQVLKREGPHGLLSASRQYLNARRQLRRTNSVGSVRLRGRVIVLNSGRISIGDHVRLNGAIYPIQLSAFHGGRLDIAAGTFLNYGCDISAVKHVSIGARCNIGQFAIIIDSHYHDLYDHSAPGARRR